jgi:hypothetical protein
MPFLHRRADKHTDHGEHRAQGGREVTNHYGYDGKPAPLSQRTQPTYAARLSFLFPAFAIVSTCAR